MCLKDRVRTLPMSTKRSQISFACIFQTAGLKFLGASGADLRCRLLLSPRQQQNQF
jgi:hypothetical protein